MNIACSGVVHIGADAGGFGRGAERSGDETRFIGRGILVARGAGKAGGFDVHFIRQVFHAVIGLGDGGRAEGVGFD